MKPEKSNYLSVGFDDDDEHDLLSTQSNVLRHQTFGIRSAYMVPIDEFDGDIVRRFLSHILYCTEHQEGFDCYQMVSFHRLHTKSRLTKYRKPLKYIGIHRKIPYFSTYLNVLFDCFIIACLQIFGITLIMYGFVEDYFFLHYHDQGEPACESSWEDWNEQKGMKLLAFCWCVVIGRAIYKFLKGSRHDGFYELVKFWFFFVDISVIFAFCYK